MSSPVGYGERVAQLARVHPDRVAAYIEEATTTRRLTYAELDSESSRLAHYYLQRGVRAHRLVTIPLPNSYELLLAMLAAWKIGAIPNPVSSHMPADELAGIIACADPALVVSAGDVEARRSFADATLPAVTDHSGERALASGGSTGKPKLILPKDRAIFNPQLVSGLFKPECAALVAGPIYHAVPFSSTWQAIFNGCSAVVMKHFDAEHALQLIEKHRIDRAWFVPTMLLRIWKLPETVRHRYDLSSLKHVLSGGAPLPPWLMQCWIEWIGAEKMYDVFGPSERIGGTLINGVEWLKHPGSVGKPLPYAQLKIFDEAGQECPVGVMGEIFTLPQSGQGSTYEYRSATGEARPQNRRIGDWESVGDMGYLDADGYLYLGDRRSDMILSRGRNIYPAEIEAAIQEYPAVRSCAVIGLPEEDGANRIHAIVDTAGTAASADEMRTFLASKLTPYKIPASFEFIDQLLRNEAGKIRRSALRQDRLAPGRGPGDQKHVEL